MNENDLREFLETSKDEIQRTVKTKMIEGLLAQNRWEISGAIAKIVEEFVAAEIVPEVKKYLQAEKGAILEASIKAAAEVSDTLAKAIVERTAKRLKADSYEFRAVMEALFK